MSATRKRAVDDLFANDAKELADRKPRDRECAAREQHVAPVRVAWSAFEDANANLHLLVKNDFPDVRAELLRSAKLFVNLAKAIRASGLHKIVQYITTRPVYGDDAGQKMALAILVRAIDNPKLSAVRNLLADANEVKRYGSIIVAMKNHLRDQANYVLNRFATTGSIEPPPAGVMLAAAMTGDTNGKRLLTQPKSQRGRPVDTNPDFDKRVFDGWMTKE